jgi:ketosteroid isomerase-like protein
MRNPTLLIAALAAAACTTKATPNATDTAAPAAATAASATDPTAVRHFIDSAQTRFIAALTKADVAALSSFYADDAVVLVPNAKAMHGRAEIDKGNADMLGTMSVTSLKLSTTDIITTGPYTIETGTYEQTLQPKTGKAIHDVGKYVVVWKQQAGGGWKIVREIYNSDPPAKS